MANGEDTRDHPNRKVGLTNFQSSIASVHPKQVMDYSMGNRAKEARTMFANTLPEPFSVEGRQLGDGTDIRALDTKFTGGLPPIKDSGFRASNEYTKYHKGK